MKLCDIVDIKSAFMKKTNLSEEEIQTIIDDIPTAFDGDKVVAELEKAKTINVDVGFGTIYKAIRKDVAIEIVKAGGILN